jgi:hypothetical protein
LAVDIINSQLGTVATEKKAKRDGAGEREKRERKESDK